MERSIGRLSYSQLSCYLSCPRKWYLQYVLKQRLEEKPQALCFGIAFHAGMERLCEGWLKSPSIALENAITHFEWTYTISKDKGPKPELYNKMGAYLLEAMSNFLSSNKFIPNDTGIERKCTKPKFRGYVDCYCEFNGLRTIIDWKTSSYPYTQEHLDSDLQLTSYGWMLEGKWDQLAFCVVNKRNREIYWYPVTRTDKQLREFELLVNRVYKELETRKEFPGVHNKEQCMAWRRKCDQWELGNCRGLDDF